MFEGWCLICAEEYELPTITAEGVCSFCQGKDCDCVDVCQDCGKDLESFGE